LFEQWASETEIGYFHVFGLIICFIRINEMSVESVGRSPLVIYIYLCSWKNPYNKAWRNWRFGCWFDRSLVDGGRSDDRFRKSRRRGGRTALRLGRTRQSSRTIRVSCTFLPRRAFNFVSNRFASCLILSALFWYTGRRIPLPKWPTYVLKYRPITGLTFIFFFFFTPCPFIYFSSLSKVPSSDCRVW
jgi:hypothetical protein